MPLSAFVPSVAVIDAVARRPIDTLNESWENPRMRHLARRVVACVAAMLIPMSILVAGCAPRPQAPSALDDTVESPLARRYVEGETTRYLMTGVNQGRSRTLNYAAEAEAKMQRDEQGRFVEEFRWTRLTVAGRDIPLDEPTMNFRQRLSLDGAVEMTPPPSQAIAGINPMLIGPVFDLMTFYVDLHPSLHQQRLKQPGDRVHVAHGQPNSWADGANVILGEDCIDFELTLERVEPASAQLRVRHLPPAATSINLPAAWMQERVNPDRPNNWVQVQRDASASPPRVVAATGHEVFDVVIEVERPAGRIVSATMDNPVAIVQRHCSDESLTDCGEPVKFQIHRHVELRRLP